MTVFAKVLKNYIPRDILLESDFSKIGILIATIDVAQFNAYILLNLSS